MILKKYFLFLAIQVKYKILTRTVKNRFENYACAPPDDVIPSLDRRRE